MFDNITIRLHPTRKMYDFIFTQTARRPDRLCTRELFIFYEILCSVYSCQNLYHEIRILQGATMLIERVGYPYLYNVPR